MNTINSLGCVVCPETVLANLNVEGTIMAPVAIPSSLVTHTHNDLRNLTIDHQRMLSFSSNDTEGRHMIDGKRFEHSRVDQQTQLGDVEEWTLRNMDDDEHPFHIHINDFQVMSVNGQPYNANGLQDTVR